MTKLVKISVDDDVPESEEEALECRQRVYPAIAQIATELSTYAAINACLSAGATLAYAVDEVNTSQLARKAFVEMCRQAAKAMEALLTQETN